MVKKLLISAFVLTTSVFAIDLKAQEQPEIKVLKDTLINIKVASPVQNLVIHYPGQASDICGLKLNTSADLPLSEDQRAELSKEIIVTNGFGVSDLGELKVLEPSLQNYELVWGFPDFSLYVTWMQVRTKSGKNLNESIQSILGKTEGLVVVQAVGCDYLSK